MIIRFIKLTLLLAASALIVACNDSSQEVKEPEPVDIQGTENINDKLLDSMSKINAKQLNQVEEVSKETLEKLSEADRQALIDLTIDESAEAVSDDADKVVERLEDVNGIAD